MKQYVPDPKTIMELIEQDNCKEIIRITLQIRKSDYKKKEFSFVWGKLIEYLLLKRQRSSAISLLKRGIIQYINEDELEMVCTEIISCRDMEMLKYVVKDTPYISVNYLAVPETLAERQFLRELMNQYTKQIEIHENTRKLWEMALESQSEKMIERLLAETDDYQYLSRMAGNIDEIFQILLRVKSKNVLDEVKKEVLLGCLVSQAWKERLELLIKKGWKKSSINKKSEILLADEYSKRISAKKYKTDRKGKLEQISDQSKVRYLRRNNF